MSSSEKTKERRFSQDSSGNSDELLGKGKVNGRTKETGDRLQREHFLKPDSDQIDLNLLLDAVLDINDKLRTQEEDADSYARKYTEDRDSVCTSKLLRMKASSTQETPKRHETRQNYSFRNEQVLAIDMENQRLLREISRPRPRSAVCTRDRKLKSSVHEPVRIKTSSEVNRKRLQRRIDDENQALLRRLEAVKPTKSLNREYLLRSQSSYDKKSRSRPSSACSSSGMLGTRSRMFSEYHFNAQDDVSSVTSVKSSRKKISKPEWEAGW